MVLAVIFIVGACGQTPAADPTATATGASEPATEEATEETETEPETGSEASGEVTAPQQSVGSCTAQPLPELDIRPVDETDWTKGASAEDAELTIYEYSDFQCPGCGALAPVMQQFLDDNPEVRLVYRHFPLDFHDKAFITAEAAEAAGAQGKFWEMHDMIFENKAEWEELSQDEAREKMIEYAEALELDTEPFETALEEGTYRDKIESQFQEAKELQLPGTPSFIFDNILFPSDIGLSYAGLQMFRDFLVKQDDLFFDTAPEMIIDEEASYQATLETSAGDIVIDLFPQTSPTHVNNFVFLSEENWYEGSDFFFVQDDFVAVTGDPSNSSIGYPGYYCQGEMETSIFDGAGYVGMLGNGQFFISLGEQASQLNGQFAMIGEVVEGMDVAQNLTRLAVGDPASPDPDVLESVEIVEQ
jgi:protein-disulfide isomerase/cyclophilin family peptidyl-prolyl cis-trans isomerase